MQRSLLGFLACSLPFVIVACEGGGEPTPPAAAGAPAGNTSEAPPPSGDAPGAPNSPAAGGCASVPRGEVRTIYTDPAIGTDAPKVASIAPVCNSVFLVSSRTGAIPAPANWWTAGWVKRCDASNCAGTITSVDATGLHYGAQFEPVSDGFYLVGSRPITGLGKPPPAGIGDLFKLSNDGTLANLGPLLETVNATAYLSVLTIPGYMMVDHRNGQNHGSWRTATLVKLGAQPSVVGSIEGGELNGNVSFATPTRLFVRKASNTGSSLVQIDTATGGEIPYFPNSLGPPFAFGERIGAIVPAAAPGGPRRQMICESDQTCAAPTQIDAPLLPDFGHAGVVGDELLFVEGELSATTLQLKSCSKAQMLAGPCTPSLVGEIPPPAGWSQTGGFSPTTNGKALFYLASEGRVVRVGL